LELLGGQKDTFAAVVSVLRGERPRRPRGSDAFAEAPGRVMQTPVHHHTKLVFNSLVDMS